MQSYATRQNLAVVVGFAAQFRDRRVLTERHGNCTAIPPLNARQTLLIPSQFSIESDRRTTFGVKPEGRAAYISNISVDELDYTVWLYKVKRSVATRRGVIIS